MNHKILYASLTIALLLMMLNFASADGVQYFQEKRILEDNITLRNFASVTYGGSSYDTVTSGKDYETYIWYHTYVDTWNEKNPSKPVYYCSLRVDYSKANSNTVVTLTQQNFTTTLDNGKYFVKLGVGDSYYVYADCVFTTLITPQNTLLEMPIDFSIVEPTYECQACQYYNWLKDEIQLSRARTLQDYTTSDIGFIKSLFIIFYELFIITFWILMIVLLMGTVGLIFLGFSWLLNYLQRISR